MARARLIDFLDMEPNCKAMFLASRDSGIERFLQLVVLLYPARGVQCFLYAQTSFLLHKPYEELLYFLSIAYPSTSWSQM